jgi:hypothetical protein
MVNSTKKKVEIKTVSCGGLIDPIVTVEDVPAEVEVGDKVTPKITVEKAVGQPLVGASIDFFIEDTLGVVNLGSRQITNASGIATASDSYYVGEPEESQTIKIVIVIQKKKL